MWHKKLRCRLTMICWSFQGTVFHLPQVSIHCRLCFICCAYADPSSVASKFLTLSRRICRNTSRSSRSVGCARALRMKTQSDSFSDFTLLAYCKTPLTVSSRSSTGSSRDSKKRRKDQPEISLGCLKHQVEILEANAETTQSYGKGAST